MMLDKLVSRFVFGPEDTARNHDRFWLYIVFSVGFLFVLLLFSLARQGV